MYIEIPKLIEEEKNAILKKLIGTLKKYIKSADSASNDILAYVLDNEDLDRVTDAIASYLPFDINKSLNTCKKLMLLKEQNY